MSMTSYFLNRELSTPINYAYEELNPDDGDKIRELSDKNFRLCIQRHPDLPKKTFVCQETQLPRGFMDLLGGGGGGATNCKEHLASYKLIKMEGITFSHHQKFDAAAYNFYHDAKIFSAYCRKDKKNMASVILFFNEETAVGGGDDESVHKLNTTRAVIGLYARIA